MTREFERMLPAGSRRRIIAGNLKRRIKEKHLVEMSYTDWIKKCEPGTLSPIVIRGKKLSIIVPCYNTPDKYIRPLIDSVINQTYTNWQLCVGDGSTDENIAKAIEQICSCDERITYVRIKQNLGIAGNTNQALAAAKGDYIIFLDHDDTLPQWSLNEVAAAIKSNPKADLIYSDEDKLTDDGRQRLLPFFKPDWSPDLLLGVNYITHLVAARHDLVVKLGGLRVGFDGAQDYDFLLRLTEITDKIVHIPKILYHWRQAEGSTSVTAGQKSYADTAGQKALSDAVKRRGIKAKVIEIPERPTNYRLKYSLPAKPPLVSIIIPFKDKVDLLKQCVDSILTKTTYPKYEIILISNNSNEAKTTNYLRTLENQSRINLFEWNQPFNYAALNNFGRSKAKGEYLVLLNNDTEIITPHWIEELVGVAAQPNIGAVGPLLLYPDYTIQHAGIILGLGGMAGHIFRGHKKDDWTDFGLPAWPRNYLAVTGACLAIGAKKYDQVGGLDEKFIMAGNDVALGISLFENGYRNVYWPFVELVHHENQSVGSYKNAPLTDYKHSLKYYKLYLNWGDSYFNPNLDLIDESVKLRSNYGSK